MIYKNLLDLIAPDKTAQQDTITICLDGEYYPATIKWHKNDIVDQYVIEPKTEIENADQDWFLSEVSYEEYLKNG